MFAFSIPTRIASADRCRTHISLHSIGKAEEEAGIEGGDVDKVSQTFEASAASCIQRRRRRVAAAARTAQTVYFSHPSTTGADHRHPATWPTIDWNATCGCRSLSDRDTALAVAVASGKALTKVQQVVPSGLLPSTRSTRILRPQRCHLNINICHRVSCRIPRAVASCGPRNVPKNKQNPIKVKWNMAREKQQQHQQQQLSNNSNSCCCCCLCLLIEHRSCRLQCKCVPDRETDG